jgi:hypothetical protein
MKAQLTATKTPLLAALVAAGAMIGASVAHAVPTITISSPGETDIVVTDGGIGDDDGVADGKIEFSENISSFNFVGSTAFTKPFLGTDALQIDTAFTAVSLGAGDVTITFSEWVGARFNWTPPRRYDVGGGFHVRYPQVRRAGP